MQDTRSAGWSPPAWADYLLVALVAGVIVFWRMGAQTLNDHECKLGLSARAMTSRGEWLLEGEWPGERAPTAADRWLVPVENGRPRLGKTPLPYWTAAGAGIIYRELGGGGEAINNITARIPSAICAVLCAVVALALGRRMFSQRAALLGALLLATCIGFQKWGRSARPEIMLCLLVTAAMAAFYCGIEADSRRRHVAWMAAFWVLLGLANLAKQFVPFLAAWPVMAYLCWRESAIRRGDRAALVVLRAFLIAVAVGLAVAVAVPLVPALHWWRRVGVSEEAGAYLTMAAGLGLPMLLYLWVAKAWRQVLWLLPTALPGLVIAVAMFAWWMVYIARLFPHLAGEVLAHEVTDRGAGVGGWAVSSPFIYLRSLAMYTLPWVALVPGACAVAIMRRFQRHRSGLVFLLTWCVGFVVVFSAAAGKREHYILPMLPAFCLLMGFVAEDVFFTHAWIRPRLARWIGASYAPVGLVGVAAAMVYYFLSGREERWGHMGIVAAVVTVPVALAGLLIWRGRFRGGLAILLASITLVYLGYYNWVRLWDGNRAVAQFAAAAAQIVPPTDPVYHWSDPQAKTVFYFGRYVPAVQWSIQRQDPGLSRRASLDPAERYLAGDPRLAPWMFAYSKDMPRLGPLGYRVVLESHGWTESGLVFVLCRRQGTQTAPSSSPAPAD